jgi:hypothetical protein
MLSLLPKLLCGAEKLQCSFSMPLPRYAGRIELARWGMKRCGGGVVACVRQWTDRVPQFDHLGDTPVLMSELLQPSSPKMGNARQLALCGR